MFQIAVFVDAGYLHKQGSALLSGSSGRREQNRLNVSAVLAELTEVAATVSPDARLLRIYWYDGVTRGGDLNLEQRTLAQSDNVKCRFGIINSEGKQKGVDSLIVSDLIQLAREKILSDALLLSGDEDLRVAVQIAQSFGIRVHLLGIQPARGSQSLDLLAEADTTREWGANSVERWLTIATPPVEANQDAGQLPTIEDVVRDRVVNLSVQDARSILSYYEQNRNQLPADFDRPSLGMARVALGRDLTSNERRDFRSSLVEAVKQRLETK